MAKYRWQSIALALTLLLGQALCAITMNPKKIGDVFKVDIREYPQFPSSCLRRLEQGLNGNTNPQAGSQSPPLYNPNAEFGQSRGNALNNMVFSMPLKSLMPR